MRIKRILSLAIFFVLLSRFGFAEDIEEKIDKLRNKLPEIKVQETMIQLTPKTRLYLPNGSMDLSLQQKIRKTTFVFASRYDFVDNFMGFNLDFLYDLSPYSIGVALNDSVDFSEIFSSTQYLQRTQSIYPYFQYALNRNARLKTGLRFENTYTDSVSSTTRLDFGRNIVGDVGFWYDNIQEDLSRPRGGSRSFDLQHSFKILGSNYEYTLAEVRVHQYLHSFSDHYIEYEILAGYPMEVNSRPLTSQYTAGGYRFLRGYGFKEFRGEALFYNQLTYHIPVTTVEPKGFLGITWAIVTWDVFTEGAKIGDRNIFSEVPGFKWNLGTGFGYKVMLFNRLPIQVEIAAAKAFEGRMPQYYFTVSTIYYSWQNE